MSGVRVRDHRGLFGVLSYHLTSDDLIAELSPALNRLFDSVSVVKLTDDRLEPKLKKKLAREAGRSLAEFIHDRQCTPNRAPFTSPHEFYVCMCANLDPDAWDR